MLDKTFQLRNVIEEIVAGITVKLGAEQEIDLNNILADPANAEPSLKVGKRELRIIRRALQLYSDKLRQDIK